jgi:hypothetical protein
MFRTHSAHHSLQQSNRGLGSSQLTTRSHLLYTALALGSSFLNVVKASPPFRLNARHLYVAESCDDFLYGANKIKVGQVCARIVDGTMTLSFKSLSDGFSYSDLHVWVGTSIPTDTIPGRALGSFPYTVNNGKCVLSEDKLTGTCSFPVVDSWRSCTDKLYIVTHRSIANAAGGQTAWGAGTCYGTTNRNCPKYWSLTRTCFYRSTSFPPLVPITVWTSLSGYSRCLY